MLAYLLLLAIETHQPRIPLHFEPNQGQVAGETEWIAKARGGTLYITGAAVAFATTEPGGKPRIMRFVGARPVKGEGLESTGGYSNYFDGRDERQWRSGIPHFGKVRYKGLYQGIDLVYYASPDRQIEYDLEVQAGADIKQIEFSFGGFDRTEIDDNGDLNLWLGGHAVRKHRPRVRQGNNEIACTYMMLSGNRVKLEVADHDEALPITIDPVLDFSTYLGGPGQDFLSSVALDATGGIYVAGYTQTPSSPTLNPFQQPNTVVGAVFVAKLTPDADKILYFSVLRSSGFSRASGLGVDATGSPTLAGITASADFPLKNPFQKDYKAGYYTGFVTRLSTDGRTIIYSSYYGGSSRDNLFHGVLDRNGDFVLSGNTSSHDIPIKNAFQPAFGGGTADCFLARVAASGVLVFSTYFGGSGADSCTGALSQTPAARFISEVNRTLTTYLSRIRSRPFVVRVTGFRPRF